MGAVNDDQLARSFEKGHLFAPSFAYDYLAPAKGWQETAPDKASSLPLPFEVHLPMNLRLDSDNGIELFPEAAGYPYYGGIRPLRQSKHWQHAIGIIQTFLEHIRDDYYCQAIKLNNGITFSRIAEKELAMAPSERLVRFSIYMYPEADPIRTALLAQIMHLIFLFDDGWEQAESDQVELLKKDFVCRLRPEVKHPRGVTPLQIRLDTMTDGFLAMDARRGNGGTEVLTALADFFEHERPPEQFFSLRQYLDYRYVDVAARFAYCCIKFSLASSVDLDSPHFQYLHKLIGDHISIANDIVSYDKEKRAFDQGKCRDITNAVHVIKQVDKLGDSQHNIDPDAEAKIRAWGIQTEMCVAIQNELNRLAHEGLLTEEEWRYVEGVLLMAAGNAFTGVVIKRFGGEEARIFRNEV